MVNNMILADKIMTLRKQRGWSQEELADKMNISRQSVSKWESGASIPDLDKILKLSEIFGVSTDYLLKDEKEDVEYVSEDALEEQTICRISMEEAGEFMESQKAVSIWMALATMLCVMSPTPLLFMLGFHSTGKMSISEGMTAILGVVILLLIVAAATALFIIIGSLNKKYEYLEECAFVLDYGVRGVVEKEKEAFNIKYVACTAVATVMCILSAVPLFAMILVTESGSTELSEDFLVLLGVVILLWVVAVAVFLFVWVNTRQGAYDKLLQKGEYTRKRKENKKRSEVIHEIYWSLVTAVYLGVSFWTMKWHITWIIWPVAAVAGAVLDGILRLCCGGEEE
ncbi:MAG: helix-turn-helix transcriptional regulator [Lachnospiraceae bacterium]|nr:helix-turn-helix transcriptional regulator [Lachnospiraceae bacterium]